MGTGIIGRRHRWVPAVGLLSLACLVTTCGSAASNPSERPTSQVATSAAKTPAPAMSTANPSGSSYPRATTPSACSPTSGGTTQSARITDLRMGTADGHDTLVIQFDNAVPHYELGQNSTGVQFTGGGGKGGTFTLAGTHGFRLNIYNLNWTVPPGNQYPHGTDILQSAPALQETRQIGDYEGIVNIAIGLSRDICPDVSILAGPPRLVIQFPTG